MHVPDRAGAKTPPNVNLDRGTRRIQPVDGKNAEIFDARIDGSDGTYARFLSDDQITHTRPLDTTAYGRTYDQSTLQKSDLIDDLIQANIPPHLINWTRSKADALFENFRGQHLFQIDIKKLTTFIEDQVKLSGEKTNTGKKNLCKEFREFIHHPDYNIRIQWRLNKVICEINPKRRQATLQKEGESERVNAPLSEFYTMLSSTGNNRPVAADFFYRDEYGFIPVRDQVYDEEGDCIGRRQNSQ
jgi:hypothetical protein